MLLQERADTAASDVADSVSGWLIDEGISKRIVGACTATLVSYGITSKSEFEALRCDEERMKSLGINKGNRRKLGIGRCKAFPNSKYVK
jgi:hypothetical protein